MIACQAKTHSIAKKTISMTLKMLIMPVKTIILTNHHTTGQLLMFKQRISNNHRIKEKKILIQLKMR